MKLSSQDLTVPAVVVANHFVERAQEDGNSVDLLKLIKLVYIAHGWHLGYAGDPLIRETVEAWKYGPVIRSVYDAFKHCGSKPITKPAATGLAFGAEDGSIGLLPDGDKLLSFLGAVWREYGKFSGVELSEMTHRPGTPWYEAWHDDGGKNQLGAVIDDGKIRGYYEERKG